MGGGKKTESKTAADILFTSLCIIKSLTHNHVRAIGKRYSLGPNPNAEVEAK